MVNRNINLFSLSLTIGEMQVRTTMMHHLTPVQMAIIKTSIKDSSVAEDVEKVGSPCTDENVNECSHYGKSVTFPQKCSSPTSGCLCRGMRAGHQAGIWAPVPTAAKTGNNLVAGVDGWIEKT